MGKSLRVRAGLVAALALVAAVASAQVTVPSTTLSSAIGTTDTTLTLASTTGIQVGSYLFADRETMPVTAVLSSTVATVQRGYSGLGTAHGANTIVYYGPPSSFFRSDPPSPSCIVQTSLNPYINIATGTVWQCAAQTPVVAGFTSVGVWAQSVATSPAAPVNGYFLGTPTTTNNGNFWVDCTGVSPSRVCAIKFQDGGVVRTLVSITY